MHGLVSHLTDRLHVIVGRRRARRLFLLNSFVLQVHRHDLRIDALYFFLHSTLGLHHQQLLLLLLQNLLLLFHLLLLLQELLLQYFLILSLLFFDFAESCPIERGT